MSFSCCCFLFISFFDFVLNVAGLDKVERKRIGLRHPSNSSADHKTNEHIVSLEKCFVFFFVSFIFLNLAWREKVEQLATLLSRGILLTVGGSVAGVISLHLLLRPPIASSSCLVSHLLEKSSAFLPSNFAFVLCVRDGPNKNVSTHGGS